MDVARLLCLHQPRPPQLVCAATPYARRPSFLAALKWPRPLHKGSAAAGPLSSPLQHHCHNARHACCTARVLVLAGTIGLAWCMGPGLRLSGPHVWLPQVPRADAVRQRGRRPDNHPHPRAGARCKPCMVLVIVLHEGVSANPTSITAAHSRLCLLLVQSDTAARRDMSNPACFAS